MDGSVVAGCAVAAIVPVLGVVYFWNPKGIVHGKGSSTPTEGPTDSDTVVED